MLWDEIKLLGPRVLLKSSFPPSLGQSGVKVEENKHVGKLTYRHDEPAIRFSSVYRQKKKKQKRKAERWWTKMSDNV